MLARVQVATLLRLKELRTDRDCRSIPPEPTEDVGGTSRLTQPAVRRNVRPPSSKIKSVLALTGNGPVALKAEWPGIPWVMPVNAGRLKRQPLDRLSKSAPRRQTHLACDIRRSMRWLGPSDSSSKDSDHDCALTGLGNAVVGGVQDSPLDRVAEPTGRSLERRILGRAEQLRHVLHDERRGFALTQRTQILSPQSAPLESDALHVERREALAGRTADHHVGFRER